MAGPHAEGPEFLRAFARFFVDRSDFDRTITSLETDAARAARTIEQSLKARAGAALPAAAAGPAEETARRLGRGAAAMQEGEEAARRFTSAHVEVSRTIKQVAQAATVELNPALAQAIDSLRNATQAGKAFGVGVGVAVGALTVASVAFGAYVARLRQARQEQIELNLAAERLDFGAARGQIDRAKRGLDELARIEEDIASARFFSPNIRAVVGVIDKLFGESEEEIRQRLTRAQATAREVFERLEAPRLRLQTDQARVGVEKQLAEIQSRRASTAAEILVAAERQAWAVRRQADLQAQLVELDARREAHLLRQQGLLREAGEVERLAAEQAKALREAAEAAAEQAVSAERRRAAELDALEHEAAARRLERLNARTQAEFQAAQETLQVERRLEEARAEAAGQTAAGLATFQIERRRLTEEAVAAELEGLRRLTAAREAALRSRLSAAEGEERVRLEQQLTDVLADAEEARLAILRRAEQQRRQLQVQEFEERQRLIRQELALEEQRFQHRLRLGQATIPEELAFLQRQAEDARRTEQERAQASEQSRQRIRELDQQLFDFQRQLGRQTLADEVARNRELVALAKAGTQERFEAERRLAESLRQLRQQAIGAAQGALGFARQEFGEEAFTRRELERRFRERQREAEEVRRRFGAGGVVTAEELERAFQIGGLQEQVEALGVSVGEALKAGLEAALTPVREVLAGIGQETVQQLQATLAVAGAEAGAPLVSAYQGAFDQILAAAGGFVQRLEATVTAGSSRIAGRVADSVYDQIVGRFERELRRA